MAAIHVDALPSPSQVEVIDDPRVWQSDWRMGLLTTRVPDPTVRARRYRLTWTARHEVIAAVQLHYETFREPFEWTPPPGAPGGVQPVQVVWVVGPQKTAVNNIYATCSGELLVTTH